MKELIAFHNYEDTETLDDLFLCRCRCQDAKKELTEIIEKIDAELIRRMKKEHIREFATGPEGNRQKVYYKHESKETVNVAEIKKLLLSDDTRDLALIALGDGQAAWKKSEVHTIQDTLGRTDLLSEVFTDKIEVKVLDVDKLIAMGKMKPKQTGVA